MTLNFTLHPITSVLLGLSIAFGPALECLPTAAAELADIQERGQLIVGVKDNIRPLGFRTEEGQLIGFEIDLARQLALELLKIETTENTNVDLTDLVLLQPLSNQDRIPQLLEDQVDVLIARLSITTPRTRLVDFSTPYYLDGTALVTKEPLIADVSDLSSPALSNQRVAVLNHSSTIDIVRSRLPGIQLVGVDSYQDALEQLEAGTIAAFAADVSLLSGWVQDYPQYRILPTLLSAEALAIALPRGLQYQDLRENVNTIVEGWAENGWLQERMEYWGLP